MDSHGIEYVPLIGNSKALLQFSYGINISFIERFNAANAYAHSKWRVELHFGLTISIALAPLEPPEAKATTRIL